jgi:hypothetical protein
MNDNRIWMELDLSEDELVNIERAGKLSQVLRHLWTIDYDPIQYSIKDGRYRFQYSDFGAYETLKDNGHWFNLDYMTEKLPRQTEEA